MSAVAVTSLAEQEAIIEENLGAVFKVGEALWKIREGELYRESGFDGWMEYLDSKPWGIAESHARNQIDAAKVAAAIGTNGANLLNERQARELAPLVRQATPDVVRQVYEEEKAEAEAEGRRVTAASLREKVSELLPKKKREAPKANAGALIQQATFATGLAHSARRSYGRIPVGELDHLIKEAEGALTRWQDIVSELQRRKEAAT